MPNVKFSSVITIALCAIFTLQTLFMIYFEKYRLLSISLFFVSLILLSTAILLYFMLRKNMNKPYSKYGKYLIQKYTKMTKILYTLSAILVSISLIYLIILWKFFAVNLSDIIAGRVDTLTVFIGKTIVNDEDENEQISFKFFCEEYFRKKYKVKSLKLSNLINKKEVSGLVPDSFIDQIWNFESGQNKDLNTIAKLNYLTTQFIYFPLFILDILVCIVIMDLAMVNVKIKKNKINVNEIDEKISQYKGEERMIELLKKLIELEVVQSFNVDTEINYNGALLWDWCSFDETTEFATNDFLQRIDFLNVRLQYYVKIIDESKEETNSFEPITAGVVLTKLEEIHIGLLNNVWEKGWEKEEMIRDINQFINDVKNILSDGYAAIIRKIYNNNKTKSIGEILLSAEKAAYFIGNTVD